MIILLQVFNMHYLKYSVVITVLVPFYEYFLWKDFVFKKGCNIKQIMLFLNLGIYFIWYHFIIWYQHLGYRFIKDFVNFVLRVIWKNYLYLELNACQIFLILINLYCKRIVKELMGLLLQN